MNSASNQGIGEPHGKDLTLELRPVFPVFVIHLFFFLTVSAYSFHRRVLPHCFILLGGTERNERVRSNQH